MAILPHPAMRNDASSDLDGDFRSAAPGAQTSFRSSAAADTFEADSSSQVARTLRHDTLRTMRVPQRRHVAAMPHVAVLIPCYNEELTIGKVVADFRSVLPDAVVYVYDNNSHDRTQEAACAAGAVVGSETMQGKGNVIRRMFADIEADVYIMVDGDDTYDAEAAPELVSTLIEQRLDMVSARRMSEAEDAYRAGHRFGNKLLSGMIRVIFGDRCRDVLSGYRVMSRRFVKSFPALAGGFDIEAELTIHALELRVPTRDVDTAYRARPEGSVSKLRTYHDGARICLTILHLLKEERPFLFFGSIFAALALASIGISIPIFITYFQTGLVPRFPTAILATGTMLLSFLSLMCGLVLETVTLGRREAKRMRYLAYAAPRGVG
jgi:glycosyltransferase involved in cell wall biosynthesis